MDFIHVRRIVRDNKGVQKIVPEVMRIDEIKTFRPWYKNDNDTFEGDAILILLKSSSRVTGQPSEKADDNGPTMMIQEEWGHFLDRMSGKVIIIGK